MRTIFRYNVRSVVQFFNLVFFLLSVSLFSLAQARADSRTPLKVEKYQPERVYAGTTAFIDSTVSNAPRIVEIDFQGNVVWSYDIPLSLVNSTAGDGYDVKWLPNDHFLFVLPSSGVFEVDREKKIVWSYRTGNISHLAQRLPNGNTMAGFGNDQASDAQAYEITPNGKIVWEWHADKSLSNIVNVTKGRKDAQAAANSVKGGGRGGQGGQGFTHTNAVARLPNGNTLISLRNLGTIVEVDAAGKVVWLNDDANGTHAPEILANGNILVNFSGRNQVVEFTRGGERVWVFRTFEYGGSNRYAHRLPNGNTLIATGNRLLEVTSSGDIVWLTRLTQIADVENRHEGPSYQAFSAPDGRLFTATRIPPRNSADFGKWWDDPANRPPASLRTAMRPGDTSSGPRPPVSMTPRFDANGDGVVTVDEFVEGRRQMFQAADVNQDGFLSRKELLDALPSQMPLAARDRIFSRADSDGDERISEEEFDSVSVEIFRSIDHRGSNRLNAEEVTAMRPPVLFGLPVAAEVPGGSGTGRPGGPRAGQRQ